ncbi:MAG: molybdopterin molybdenumtransferase MoeA [Candidatus Thiodiazotropha sp. (ex Ctena orbiculata)]|nr:molybdopterin molybdenumtransferase MoeA [Candidatus Thiodiazotropha taylori]PUB88709.1 MAG: molybdopterin molybdenumtransferase MoeA [gamma proteobacterium symbiont of Ctena orbiculata]MBT2998813.1 molybdopterin molybdenumtransferase MoeA [Candidatus Thiodiazotropha taylori]MBT3002311.1 molybdopterin molybdenumtransferase MoeA [Candidatus Thiodiazotropha taylori]MBT3028739.1 molybdopterin molybdenumtransferase MoeA [Candidatus Thiodiazotropha taylori]
MSSQAIGSSVSCADPEAPSTLTVAAAREAILKNITPVRTTLRLPLRDALNAVLAEEIISPIDVPGHTNSAMDGYAIAGRDLPEGEYKDFTLIGTAIAGAPFDRPCGSGETIRIMTGAPMPAGTDTVVMQEQILLIDERLVRIAKGHRPGQNVRQAGEDIARGSVVLHPGRRLTPADLGILASLGFAEVSVRRRPRVAFFSTGDELRSVGEPLAAGEVYDSNRYSLHGMLRKADVELLDMGVVGDEPVALKEAFDRAAEAADIVVTSGGVSVGEADYTKAILQQLGEMQFWKIAMKPGRPLAFGKLANSHFFGLPGNPVAVMVTFYQFVLPALHYLATGTPYQPLILEAESGQVIRKKAGRYEFVRGLMQRQEDGSYRVEPVGRQGSGILTSMSRGNCFILLPEDCAGVESGDRVTVQPFDTLV